MDDMELEDLNDEQLVELQKTSDICDMCGITKEEEIIAVYDWVHQLNVDNMLMSLVTRGLATIVGVNENNELLFQTSEAGKKQLVAEKGSEAIWGQISEIIRTKDEEKQ